MKKYPVFMLLALLQFSVMAQSKTEKEPFMTKSLSSESIKDVEVRTSGGNISVSGVNASEARIEVYISGNNNKNDLSKEEIQLRLNEKYDLDISVTNNKLIAVTKLKEKITDWKKALNISFKVFVPKNISTDLTTSGGNINLENLSGKQDFSTSGGNLNVNNVSGTVSGRTSGGNIGLENSKDDIELTTSGGNIDASNCEGKLRLSTSGGSLYLKDLKGDVRATTSGGNVDGSNIQGELIAHTSGGDIHFKDLACSLETSTSGGNIGVSIRELGKYVKISNSAGNIDLDLPKNKGIDLELSAEKIKTDRLDNFSGKANEGEINGKLNGGGVLVRVDGGSGRISLGLK
ncbi:MAG TPA: DUF4097 family beta strand repeat-containing protein [Chitinophagaceae bacterium]|nr:DUF4097 family beta strand repeat-containing protein [Chitinophagaceae bacterium]